MYMLLLTQRNIQTLHDIKSYLSITAFFFSDLITVFASKENEFIIETNLIPNNSFTNSVDKLIALNVGSQLYIKLDGANYPTWRLQFLSLLTGYDLMGYINGSFPCPLKVLKTNGTALNLAFSHWVRQDQLLLHAIISSVAATVVTHLGTVQTAQQACDTLKTMYASRSRVRVMALNKCITTFTKSNQTMATYLQGIKAIADELSIINHPLTIRIWETLVTYADLHKKLVDFETLLSRDQINPADPLLATTNLVHRYRGS
ncbi:PREDICTED: uncharacterized protein LOC109337962 [Lupinus angustifolius]|uniref:uncharacterized protein LOC109337962 n=1 Tax=Lupinus angustifolius TaxID=3871 RepID=UPI00092F647E|nr:PREDICTED: uncharacterized protein LOC109337962 [Lupinus angustifolius]